MSAITVAAEGAGYLGVTQSIRHDKANNMLTLTAIVLALGLGWAVIKVWNAMSAEPAPGSSPDTEVAKQL